MRRVIFASILLLSACSAPEERRVLRPFEFLDVQQPPAMQPASPPPPQMAPAPPPIARSADASAEQAGGPNINVSAAPGVAFNYRYAFRLPNSRISAAQEAHATMCEKLGVTRCRITGMRYSVVNERDVSASLELKLDPAIARAFGKDATKVVTAAEGMLVDQQISGVDVGTSIERANRSRAELQDELERVNRELARPGLSSVVRDRLLSEAASIRAQIRSLGEQKSADEESLAKTPMAFYYGSGKTIPGFDEPQPLKDAFARAAYNFLSVIGFLVIAVATLLPWLVLGALGIWAYRRYRPRWSFQDGGYRTGEPGPSTETTAAAKSRPRSRPRQPDA